MTAHPSPRASLYASCFQPEAGDLSGFRVEQDHSEREKYLSLLETIRARIGDTPLEAPARASLEELFTRLIADQVKATFSAQDVFQMLRDACRDLDFADDGLEDDLEKTSHDAEPEQKFTSIFTAGETE